MQYIKIFSAILFGAIFLTACAESQYAVNVPATPPPVKLQTKSPRVALVLGCGGARGYAHLGILQALKEAHIPVDVIVGASAGSVVAALYADNDDFYHTYNVMMPAGFWDYADMRSLGYTGVITGYQLENFLLENMHARDFNQLKTPVIIATTEIKTGNTFAIASGPIAPAVLASAAVPGAIKPVTMYGHTLVDGGVADPVPVDLAKKLHPKLIIAVNLIKLAANDEPASAYGNYELAYDIMWQRLTTLSLQGADIVISPEVGNVGTFDLSKKREMYLAGLEAGRKAIPAIRKALAKIGN